ncbi:MAG: glycosyl hydrolase 115 family protein, partial [Lachnospiraceae bacterium]|nr:glycosyl hydrolase 115 family protein [Lachnospiraceae bacterium]
MAYTISVKAIRTGGNALMYGDGEWSGVLRIAERVASDMKAVFGRKPELLSAAAAELSSVSMPVLFGTVGKSALIAALGEAGVIDLREIAGKREVYSFTLVKNCPKSMVTAGAEGHFPTALVIAGSEKRGTVYGLFHLSEMLGVSPFTDWLDMKPARLSEFTLEDGFHFVSGEPSVRYRGFFINDEWPAFGNFCNRNYGGFNAKVYEHVFELLLRLKGNYLWPAMWSAVFPEDGPGLENARLADELGVVMGASH